MIFNSIDFAVFIPIVFFVYWFFLSKSLKGQNLFLVVVSYFFYGYWDYRFLFLIAFSSLLDFFIGLQMRKASSQKKKKLLLVASVFLNLGLLGFFKYYNFFIDEFVHVFTFFGFDFNGFFVDVLLPVGISFYTFQTLSYTIDAYKGDVKVTDDLIAFLAYVSFFPQLVAGPIERAADFLPQFQKKRYFDSQLASSGMKQILWGITKKVLIADNAAHIANEIFNNSNVHTGPTLFLGSVFFAFQIYGDFSGYSDIAIGTSRLFGFDLKMNFNFPYFSRNISEFWRRWHISLNTWFRDYLYIPLGGNRVSKLRGIINIAIVFLLSGLWHGANWTYLFWGGLNGLYFIPTQYLIKSKKVNIKISNSWFLSLVDLFKIGFTFVLTCLAWVFFRSDTFSQALNILNQILEDVIVKKAYVETLNLFYWEFGLRFPLILLVFVLVEWFTRRSVFSLDALDDFMAKSLRYIVYIY